MTDAGWTRLSDVDESLTADFDPADELAWAKFFMVQRYIQELTDKLDET